MRASESAVPFGLVRRVQANESEHALNFLDSIVECATKARDGAGFLNSKKSTQAEILKKVMIKMLFVAI